jgi:phosphomannomutase
LLTAFIAQDVGLRHKGKPMLLDVKSSDMAMDLLRQAGSVPEVWKTGHSHIKKRMKEVGAPLAGEMSGHIFIADNYYGFDDAIYAGMRVLDQCVRTGFDITAFMDSLPEQHATPELRVPCPDSDKFAAMDTITAHVLAANDPNAVSTIDGVRVRTDGGWWLLRASNTEAVLIARAEAATKDRLDNLVGDIGRALGVANLDW